jgi:hypothetical protein
VKTPINDLLETLQDWHIKMLENKHSLQYVQETAVIGIGVFIFSLAMAECLQSGEAYTSEDLSDLCQTLCEEIYEVTEKVKIEKGH